MDDNNWRKCIVADIVAPIKNALVGGPFGSNLISRDYTPVGVPVIRGQNMGFGRWVSGEFVFVSLQKADDLSGNIAREGDLIFTQRGTLGQVAIVPPKPYETYVISQSQMKLSADKSKANVKFLYYLFSSQEHQEYIRQNAIQTGVPHTNLEHLRNTPLYLPPLSEQQKIARILGSLDDKIELNRQMNETLEAMARAIFQSWFVDFDPVRAKAEGRQPEGMDATTAALFPSEFEEVDGREVPKGWGVEPLSESFNITMGQSPPGTTYNENGEGMPFFQGRTDFGFRYPTERVYCTAPTRFAEAGDSLVSVRAPVGDINLAHAKCCIGRGVAAVRHKTGSRSFTYYQMLSFKDIFALFESEGTVFGSIAKTDFSSIECITPSNEIVKKFEQMVFPTDQMIENNEQQSRTLAHLRDALLPKLMRGEIRIDNNLF